MKTQILCLVEKKHLRCDRCELPLSVRTWKNEIIALSINKRKNCGFLCVKCILNSKKNHLFYRTKKQLDKFLKENINEINLNLKEKLDYPKKYREEHKEEAKESKRKWRLNSPEKVIDCKINYRLNNPEKVKESKRKWHLNNPEKVKAYAKKYRDEHNEKNRN